MKKKNSSYSSDSSKLNSSQRLLYSNIKDSRHNEKYFRNLRNKLDCVLESIDLEERVQNDPIQFVKRYSDPDDIEIAGLIASVMALGKVELIIRNLENIFSKIDGSLADFFQDFDIKKASIFNGVKYRIYSTDDIMTLFWCIGRVRQVWGSLEKLFMEGYNVRTSENDGITYFKNGLENFSQKFKAIALDSPFKEQNKFTHFFPQPSKGSACKRLCLYTRWMVRTGKPDFGIWRNLKPAHLVVPVDTHISRIGRYLGFTDRKGQGNWKMAVEITNALEKMDPDDPLRLDFPLCHLGISGECPTRVDENKCKQCGLNDFCIKRKSI